MGRQLFKSLLGNAQHALCQLKS